MGQIIERLLLQTNDNALVANNLLVSVTDLSPTVANTSATALLNLDADAITSAGVVLVPLLNTACTFGKVFSQALVVPHPYHGWQKMFLLPPTAGVWSGLMGLLWALLRTTKTRSSAA